MLIRRSGEPVELFSAPYDRFFDVLPDAGYAHGAGDYASSIYVESVGNAAIALPDSCSATRNS